MNNSTVFDCSLINLPKIGNGDGMITSINNKNFLQIEINRIFYLYDIPSGESRGAHAHKECHQFIIAATGSFEVQLDDSKTKRTIVLNQPNVALHILPGIWASELNFSSGSICLVLASHLYDEADYIRDYKKFVLWK
jgi:hypothetical protein